MASNPTLLSLFSDEFLSGNPDLLPFSARFQQAAAHVTIVRKQSRPGQDKQPRAVDRFLKRQRMEETLVKQDSAVLRQRRTKPRKPPVSKPASKLRKTSESR
jgi:hypothetical protein